MSLYIFVAVLVQYVVVQSQQVTNIPFLCSGKSMDQERLEILDVLKPLQYYGFIIKDQEANLDYIVHLCNNRFSPAAVWQRNSTTHKDVVVLGFQNDTEVIQGSNHMIMKFGSGHQYSSGLCKGFPRSTVVILTCLPGKLHGNVKHVKASTGRDPSNCYYLFELETKVVCSEQEKTSHALYTGLKIVSFVFVLIATLVGVWALYYRGYRYRDLPAPVKSFFSRIISSKSSRSTSEQSVEREVGQYHKLSSSSTSDQLAI